MRVHNSPKQQQNPLTDAGVSVQEMGVFPDGTAFVTQSGLAKVCGVAESDIAQHADDWAAGKRDSQLAQNFKELDYGADSLYVPIYTVNGPLRAYTDSVMTIFVIHYAFDVGNPVAQRMSQAAASAGLEARIRRGTETHSGTR